MINCMDEGIGNITAALRKNGLLNNTILIFTSDNGAAIGTGDNVGGSNWPLRGGKHSIFDGGTKVPAIVYYSKLMNNKSGAGAGMVYDKLFHSSDWSPTIIDAFLSTSFKEWRFDYKFDGKSHWRNLVEMESAEKWVNI